jgi:glycosyltransferase involved in cell wall biosynthesis
MKLVVSHPTLNANAKNLVIGLLKNKLLVRLFVAVAIFPNQVLYRLGNISKLKDLKRRRLDEGWQPFVSSKPFFEFGRLLASKLNFTRLLMHETGFFCTDRIYQKHDNWVASHLIQYKKQGVTGIYAYEDGALATFTKAKQLGLTCIYDLPIGYWKSARLLMQEELLLNPAWAKTLTGFNDSDTKLTIKDQELALADVIFVASTFTKKTLELYEGTLAPVKVIPYGFPDVLERNSYLPLTNRKLRILFVGGLSQRKGLSYLCESIIGLENEVELTFVGHKAVENCEVLNDTLEQHRWIPSLSHDEVLACMREHDIFVFPSLFEGFGLVITEAMSQGIPVITTDRTAGPDLIEDGVDGWIVPAASSSAIKQVLKAVLQEPTLLEKMGRTAQEKAQTRPWSVYGQEMAKAISFLNII